MQNRTMRVVTGVVVLVVVVGILGVAYIWFSGAGGTPTEPITAPTLEAETGAEQAVFRIVPDESEARFLIQEDLMGNRITVTGKTQEIAGDIAVDFAAPASTELGTIRINVSTLATDNEFRNRALRGQILQSNQAAFEFAEFVPTALNGLPESITMGTPFTFQITGNLTVHGVTKETTFDAEVTPVSETRLEGSANAEVLYADFGMSIPSAPGVANVSDEVQLEIEFVATAVTAETE